MIKIIRKFKNRKRGLTPYEAKGFRSGFVILFAVTISSILLAIALGVTNIALKEVKFGTNARDTNDAFFAADSGAERALFMDKDDAFCAPAPCSDSFIIPEIGSVGQSCVNVTVTKTAPPLVTTTIISKGYNIGNAACTPIGDRVERELRVTY